MTEDVPVAAADAVLVELPTEAATPAARGRYDNHYSGAKRPQHKKLVIIENSPITGLDCNRYASRCELPPTEKALLQIIISKVDSRTLRWPPKHGGKGGSGVRELADLLQRSPRHTRRLLRSLEDRGLLVTLDRRPYRSEYQIMPEALKAKGEADWARHRARQNRNRIESLAAAAAADLAIDELAANETAEAAGEPGESATETDAASAADRLPEVDTLPKVEELDCGEAIPNWAILTGRKHRLPATKVAGLVRAAWRAAGAEGTWTVEGAEARNVVRTWRNLNEPSLDEWSALLDGLAAAARQGRVQLKRTGIPGLLKLTKDKAARRAAHAASGPTPSRVVAKPAPEAPERPSGQQLLPGPAHPTNLPAGDPGEWQETMRVVREQLGAVYDIWFGPCEFQGLDDEGQVVVKVPNQMYADWIRTHYGEVLALTAQAPVLLTWGD